MICHLISSPPASTKRFPQLDQYVELKGDNGDQVNLRSKWALRQDQFYGGVVVLLGRNAREPDHLNT